MKDYYKILEVNPTASQDVIAKVYKVLAKKYHPDTQSDPAKLKEAEEKFKEISEAYDVLSHPDQRQKYDEELQEEQNAKTVDINQYIELQQYCKDLENKISILNAQTQQTYYNSQINSNAAYNQASYNQANINNNYYQAQAQVNKQAYQDAMNKAYNDAYYNTLRRMGYKIRYKKPFKERMRDLLALAITSVVIFIIGFILYHIPSFRDYFKGLFTL